jgi:hypothetical protein
MPGNPFAPDNHQSDAAGGTAGGIFIWKRQTDFQTTSITIL